ncbi:MAG: type II toxin-antitoxin system MqsR family toxin [Candidatus Pacebacteria bacterium]|nr:type II toxin-antitoxin system MqsR family toxin [Candidatus Paceibacterota bacterium]
MQSKFTFIEREKNMACLAQLGIKTQNVKDIINRLTFRDYMDGPLQDKKFSKQNVWTFGAKVFGHEVYIKLSDNFKYGLAKCISFHKSEYKCKYQYKRSK